MTETESSDSPFLIGGSEIRPFAVLLIARLQFGSAGNAIERAKNLLFVVTASDISADESVLRADLTRQAARALARCGCVMIVIKIASEDPKQSETQKRTPPIRFWLLSGDYYRRCA